MQKKMMWLVLILFIILFSFSCFYSQDIVNGGYTELVVYKYKYKSNKILDNSFRCVKTCKYDTSGKILKELSYPYEIIYKYRDNGTLSEKAYSFIEDSTSSTLIRITEYNMDGSRTKKKLYLNNGDSIIWRYSYDNNNNDMATIYLNEDALEYQEDYRIDDNGNIVEKILYYQNGSIEYKSIYCKKGNLLETIEYNEDCSQNSKYSYKYDERNNLIEMNIYDNNGTLYDKSIYKYDTKGNEIEKLFFMFGEFDSYNWKHTIKYDSIGNKTVWKVYNRDGYVSSNTYYKYDVYNNIIEEIEFQDSSCYFTKRVYLYK